MSTTEIRPEAVSLFLDIDWTTSTRIGPGQPWPPKLVHRGGQPFTDAEHALFMGMTTGELEAAARYIETAKEHTESSAQDLNRVQELTKPYFVQLGNGSTLDSVRAIMPPVERTELDQILDRIAPGGYLP